MSPSLKPMNSTDSVGYSGFNNQIIVYSIILIFFAINLHTSTAWPSCFICHYFLYPIFPKSISKPTFSSLYSKNGIWEEVMASTGPCSEWFLRYGSHKFFEKSNDHTIIWITYIYIYQDMWQLVAARYDDKKKKKSLKNDENKKIKSHD